MYCHGAIKFPFGSLAITLMHRLISVAISLLPAVLYAAEQPNVIFFIADDVSWNDYGCYGSQTARTPNIDALTQFA